MNPQEKLIKIVDAAKGDDLERAEKAFAHISPPDLDQEYGASGRTCREILQSYRNERADWQAARDLLTRLLAHEDNLREYERSLGYRRLTDEQEGGFRYL